MNIQKDSKARYQPWREEEFRADLDVQLMTAAERWAYRTLCQTAFACSTRPFLPNDDGQLWKLAGCENRRQWDKLKPAVIAMFTVTEKGLSRKRILEDWNRIEDKRDNLRRAGKISGQVRGRKAKSAATRPEEEKKKGSEVKGSEVKESKEKKNVQHMLNICSTNAEHLFPSPSFSTQELVAQVVEMAVTENPAACFSDKARRGIGEALQQCQPTHDELKKVVTSVIRLMDSFELKNAGSALAVSLSGRILGLRKKAEVEKSEEIDLAAANAYVDEQIAAKKALEEIEAEKRRGQEECERTTHFDDPLCACEKCQPDFWSRKV